MKTKKILGILSIISLISLVIFLIKISADSQKTESIFIKLSIFDFEFLIVLIGLYLINTKEHLQSKIKKSIAAFGSLLAILAFLVIFNFIDFLSSWHLLVSLTIVYISSLQLIMLKTEGKSNIPSRILNLLLLLSNGFLLLFFLSKWEYYELSLWVDLSISVALTSFIVGLILVGGKSKNQSNLSSSTS